MKIYTAIKIVFTLNFINTGNLLRAVVNSIAGIITKYFPAEGGLDKWTSSTALLLLVLCSPYLQASCLDNLPRETPSDDFILDNAVVIHKKTGLMWARCSLGYHWNATSNNCDYDMQAKKALFTWPEALQQAQLFALTGKHDWRLPNKNELMSIADHGCTGPAINETIFPNTTAASYWTSSPYGTELENVWRVIFTTGDLLNAQVTSALYVRMVREP